MATSDGRGTIVVGTGGIGTRFISKDYPVVEGLSGGTTITWKGEDL